MGREQWWLLGGTDHLGRYPSGYEGGSGRGEWEISAFFFQRVYTSFHSTLVAFPVSWLFTPSHSLLPAALARPRSLTHPTDIRPRHRRLQILHRSPSARPSKQHILRSRRCSIHQRHASSHPSSRWSRRGHRMGESIRPFTRRCAVWRVQAKWDWKRIGNVWAGGVYPGQGGAS